MTIRSDHVRDDAFVIKFRSLLKRAASDLMVARPLIALMLVVSLIGFSTRVAIAQVANWVPVYPGLVKRAAMAHDSGRGVSVLFGGIGSAPTEFRSDETWEWNGSAWRYVPVLSRPSERFSHAMAYDTSRGVTVLFGGDDGALNNETWEWNGTTWAQRLVSGPSARSGHAMVYDSVLHRVILFGGLTGAGSSGETWAFDGTAWTLLSNTGPSPRFSHSMAFDHDRNVAVLFGGNAGAANGETWEWNGTSWSQSLPIGTQPAPRTDHAMAYDAASHKTVMFGGFVNGNPVAQAYEWNGTSWGIVAPAMIVSRGPAMVFDNTRNVLVAYGGPMAQRSGTSWTLVAATPPASCKGMAFDSLLNKTVLVDTNGITWMWNGRVWSQGSSSNSVPYGPLVFDSARGKIVLFGNAQTWEHDSAGWVRRSVSGPSLRGDHRMVYDSFRGVTVLFGGTSNRSDTWEWDGTSWTERVVSGPPGRQHHAMAYDSIRHVTVLFGGSVFGSPALSDTWEWDGFTWTQRMVVGPPALYGHAMSFDAARGVTVLFGVDSTWEWDGSSWSQMLRSFAPLISQSLSALGMAYDSVREVTVLQGAAYGAPTREYGSPCDQIVVSSPIAQTSCRGGTAAFTVTATGPGPFSYYWRKSSTFINVSLNPSAASPTLVLSNLQKSDEGMSWVHVPA